MLRRPLLLALPAAILFAGALVLVFGNRANAAGGPPTVTAGDNVHAAASAAVVHANVAVQPVAPVAGPGTRSRSRVIKEVLPSSVRIQLSEKGKVLRVASGVILGFGERDGAKVGYVMTNAHVVETKDPSQVKIEVLVDRKGKTRAFPASVSALGEVPEMDLALLAVQDLVGSAVTLAENADFELGDDVVAIGAPFGRGISISSGIVSQLDWDEVGAAQGFKTDAPIGYGASGGGIFRVPDGKLLAVIEGYRTAKVSFPMAEKSYSFDVPMPGETFASPAAKVRTFLRSRGVAHLLADLYPGEQLEMPKPIEAAEKTAAR